MAASQQTQGEEESLLGWTRQKLIDLVDVYKNRPCLYDNTSPGYHNRDERARAWIEIAELMSREEDEVRAKMKSIRTQYARIIQKGQHPKCKTGNTISSWWLLGHLHFLDEFIIPRKAESESIKESDLLDVSQVGNVGRIFQENNVSENGEASEMMYRDMTPEPDISQTQNDSLNNSSHQHMEDVTIVGESSTYQPPFTQRIAPISVSRPSISHIRANRLKARRPLKRKKDHIASSPPAPPVASPPSNSKLPDTSDMSANLLLKTVLTFAERNSKEDDEDAIFGRYVGNEMRSVTDIQAKRIAKMRIQKVLFEAQTGWTETSNEGVYHAPRDGGLAQDYPVGVVCNTNNSRVV